MKNQVLGFILALASMLYELILAQMLNLTLGGTIFQYTIAVGLYATSLGVGSLYYQKTNTTVFRNKKLSLNQLELILALIGICSLFITYILQHYFFLYQWNLLFFQLIVYVLIVIIGILSGLELPLLMDINNENSNSFSPPILLVDYLGTLAACLMFPLVFLPYFNLFSTLIITASLNLIVALFFSSSVQNKVCTLIALSGCGILLFFSEKLMWWLSLNFS